MEYGIPREAVPEALNRVRRLVDEAGIQLSFPVEVRAVAGDDIPLSTAHGRPTGYIAVHVYKGTPYDTSFQGVERIMDSSGGRRSDERRVGKACGSTCRCGRARIQ